MTTAILGYGVVGRATYHGVLAGDATVAKIDFQDRDDLWRSHWQHVFICLPTNSHQDLSYLAHVCRRLAAEQPSAVMIIRSSVPPGFISHELADINDQIIYFPEFIRERSWLKDSERRVWVVGCANQQQSVMEGWRNQHDILYMTHSEAEMLKMMANSFAALRVVFANHMHDLATAVGADYQQVLSALSRVQHPGQDYLLVTPDLRGFGGRCLPKDLDLLIGAFQQQGLRQTLLSAVRLDNHQWPVTVRQDITDAD